MNLVLWKKSIHESKWILLGCSLAMTAMGWIFVWVTSHFNMSKFQQLLDLIPGNLKRFTTVDFDWMITYPGRISMLFDEPIVVLTLVIFCIARASDSVSGEIGRGTMEMVLSQPVSRMQVFLSNLCVTIVGIAILVAALWLGIYLGVATTTVEEELLPSIRVPVIGWEFPLPFAEPKLQDVPMKERVDVAVFFPAVVNFFCLGIFITGMTTFLSSIDRYRWRTIGIVSAVYVAAALLKIAGMASPDFDWLLWFSFFTPYEPEAFVAVAIQSPEYTWNFILPATEDQPWKWGPTANNAVLIGIGGIFYAMAAYIFCRRDIPAPI